MRLNKIGYLLTSNEDSKNIMFLIVCLCLIVISYVICDVNYFIRTYFTVISSRYQRKYSLSEITTIYGLGTFQDCDITLKNVRLARLIRELDFARYHFYDRTGVYENSVRLRVKSLQGATFVVMKDAVPIFTPYLINTKLVYWDERSLFFEHEIMTIFDKRIRALLVSRQYAIGGSIDELLRGLIGSEKKSKCPKLIKYWLESNKISSDKLRRT